jgi:hypothetical protein
MIGTVQFDVQNIINSSFSPFKRVKIIEKSGDNPE